MQTLELFCVYDLKAEYFGSPFTARNSAVAQRLFERLCFSGESEISKAPTDYTLVHIGSFDDSNASITTIAPVTVCSGAQLLLELQSRGAAVGGISPLKQQSASNVDSSADAENPPPACETE